MQKRYQVFVSSTFADLRDERARVFQALMQMDCIPAGMELFPAMDEEQLKFIKRIIDDCDYYILIIGGRYGSMTADGISYTEMEYDYAVEKGIPVLAFIHGDPGEIKSKYAELDPDARDKLERFRAKVADGRLVKFWKTAEELKAEVVLSLSQTIKTYPGVGWVRGNATPSEELLAELNEVRKDNSELQRRLAALKAESTAPAVDNLAPLDQQVSLALRERHTSRTYVFQSTWGAIFDVIAPRLLGGKADAAVRGDLGEIFGNLAVRGASILDELTFDTVKVQFMALNLVTVRPAATVGGGVAVFWNLTPKGHQLMLASRSVKAVSDATKA